MGGGYAECGLSDLALEWMIGRARAAGVDRAIGADPTQSVHPSVKARWDADPGYRPRSLKNLAS